MMGRGYLNSTGGGYIYYMYTPLHLDVEYHTQLPIEMNQKVGRPVDSDKLLLGW